MLGKIFLGGIRVIVIYFSNTYILSQLEVFVGCGIGQIDTHILFSFDKMKFDNIYGHLL